MTLARTIHRRNARKRAKLRPKSTANKFITPDWLIRDVFLQFHDDIRTQKLIARKYPR